MRLIIQNHVFPFQRCGNELGGKADVVVRLVLLVQKDMAQELFRRTELSAQERLAFAGALQPQDIPRIEPVVFLEHADDSFLFLHVLPGDNERCGLAGRQETTVRQAFPTAELGVLAVEVLVLHKEYVQCLRAGVRHQGQHNHHTLAERDFLPSGHTLQPSVNRRRNLFYRRILAPLLEV